jgi:hypothetical protein
MDILCGIFKMSMLWIQVFTKVSPKLEPEPQWGDRHENFGGI